MNLRKATHLVSSLLLAVGLGVFSDLAEAQNSRAKKPSASARRSGTHSKKSSKRYELRERGQKAPTPDRISEIQQALAKDGSYTGNPNGKWDDSTVEAMKKFQEAHGLNPTGKLDARSLQQLGLGSAIAGVARPLPSNTTSKLTPPSTQAGQHRN